MTYNKLIQTIPIPTKCVFNLTSIDLSPYSYLFNLGIKHIPLPLDISNEEINLAFNNFKNRTLWQLSLDNKPNVRFDDDDILQYHPKLKKRKTTIKTCHMINRLHFIHDIFDDIDQYLQRYIINNPPTTKICCITRDILRIKKQHPELVFVPADKNLGLSIIHITQYDSLINQHLKNEENYLLCCDDNIAMTRSLLQQCTMAFISFRNDNFWYTYEKRILFCDHDFKFPKFHILPKLHKKGTLQGRPISGQVNWITTPISRILDIRLQNHLHLFPYILKNSQTLVNELDLYNRDQTFIDSDDIVFITADIVSLYPNINLDKLYAIINTIDNSCSPLVKFVCDNSYCSYDRSIYKQINGIAMGTNAAVSLANIYVGTLIDEYIGTRPQIIGYRRYIDDLFIIWKGPLDTWTGAKHNIQTLLGSSINFDPPSKTVNFLDIIISKNQFNGKIDTSVFQKSLNKYSYISPCSFHPETTLSGFIKGELTRYARLSNSILAYKETKTLFYQRLIKRGYTRLYLSRIFKHHQWSIRFEPQDSTTGTILPFVIPYTMRNNINLLRSYLKLREEEITKHFNHARIVLAYSKRPSIFNKLCSSAISLEQSRILRNPQNTPRMIRFD